MNRLDISRVFQNLEAFRNRLPNHQQVSATYVDWYHKVLEPLADIGDMEDVVETNRVSAQEMISLKLPNETTSSLTRHPIKKVLITAERENYRERFVVDRALLLMKVDAVLGVLSLYLQEPEKKIGFRK